MTTERLAFFYDRQIERYLEQFVRAFSVFSYETGQRGTTTPQTLLVPCRMAMADRSVANIVRNNSDNTALCVPQITVGISDMQYDNTQQGCSHLVETLSVSERQVGTDGHYTKNKGNSYNVKRMMPVPFTMTIQVDIWTSNQLQKFQLFEQISTTIWPTFDIQNSDNGLDWSAITYVSPLDMVWSSRQLQTGVESEIDIMTFRFKVPIRVNPPAKVQKMTRIETIVANVSQGDQSDIYECSIPSVGGSPLMQVITTPGDMGVMAQVTSSGGVLKLLSKGNGTDLSDSLYKSWTELFTAYGSYVPGVTTVSVVPGSNIEGHAIVGTVQLNQNDPTELFWQVDLNTLPANTLPAINAVIYPLKTYPGQVLPSPVAGTRYLILEDISPSIAWPNITAKAGDIIEFNGTAWTVTFTAATSSSLTEYVVNQSSGQQLFWNGKDWVIAIEAEYGAGFWRLSI